MKSLLILLFLCLSGCSSGNYKEMEIGWIEVDNSKWSDYLPWKSVPLENENSRCLTSNWTIDSYHKKFQKEQIKITEGEAVWVNFAKGTWDDRKYGYLSNNKKRPVILNNGNYYLSSDAGMEEFQLYLWTYCPPP